jgi:nucleoid-associated protein YgaU
MEPRRLTGGIALIVVLMAMAALVYYDFRPGSLPPVAATPGPLVAALPSPAPPGALVAATPPADTPAAENPAELPSVAPQAAVSKLAEPAASPPSAGEVAAVPPPETPVIANPAETPPPPVSAEAEPRRATEPPAASPPSAELAAIPPAETPAAGNPPETPPAPATAEAEPPKAAEPVPAIVAKTPQVADEPAEAPVADAPASPPAAEALVVELPKAEKPATPVTPGAKIAKGAAPVTGEPAPAAAKTEEPPKAKAPATAPPAVEGPKAEPARPLPPPHTEIARSGPPAGNMRGAPAKPGEASPDVAPGVEAMPSFEVVQVENSGDAVVAGVAAAGATVEVLDGGRTVATARANDRGEWALSLDPPMPPGPHDLAIRTTSADKATVTISDQRVAVSIPDKPTEEPLVVLNTPDEPSHVIEMPVEKPAEVALAPAQPVKPDVAPEKTPEVAEIAAPEPRAEATRVAPPSTRTEVAAVPTETPIEAKPAKTTPDVAQAPELPAERPAEFVAAPAEPAVGPKPAETVPGVAATSKVPADKPAEVAAASAGPAVGPKPAEPAPVVAGYPDVPAGPNRQLEVGALPAEARTGAKPAESRPAVAVASETPMAEGKGDAMASAASAQADGGAKRLPKVATAAAGKRGGVGKAGAAAEERPAEKIASKKKRPVAKAPGAEVATEESPRIRKTPVAPAILPKVGVSAVEADTSGGLFIAGTAVTGDPVRVYLDDTFLGETKPAGGTWLLELRRELPAGRYDIRADQVDSANGDVIVPAAVPFQREIEVVALRPVGETGGPGGASASGAMPDPETIIIRRHDNLWRMSRRMYGKGVRWSTLYQANKDQIRNPRWIFPGQLFVVPSSDTTWKD